MGHHWSSEGGSSPGRAAARGRPGGGPAGTRWIRRGRGRARGGKPGWSAAGRILGYRRRVRGRIRVRLAGWLTSVVRVAGGGGTPGSARVADLSGSRRCRGAAAERDEQRGLAVYPRGRQRGRYREATAEVGGGEGGRGGAVPT